MILKDGKQKNGKIQNQVKLVVPVVKMNTVGLTRKVSKDTPKTKYELTPSKLAAKKAEKSKVGMGRKVTKA